MSSYVLKILMPEERVTYAATLHWIIYLQGLIFTVAGGVLGYYTPAIVMFVFGDELGGHIAKPFMLVSIVVFSMGVMLLLGAYIRQVSTELVVTNCRVIAKYGYISRATFELMITRVTGANFDQTVVGRVLGFGTIIVRGAGGDISPIDNVADPQMFHNQVMAAFERATGGNAATAAPGNPAATARNAG